MNECLIIRISNQQNVNTAWWIWSDAEQKVLDKGYVDIYEASDFLVELSEDRKVYLLLSGADVNLLELELPTARLRHLDKALPYLLEDRLADEVEDLHFSQLFKQGASVYTAVMAKDWFSELILHFQTLGIKLANVIPEVLALPYDGRQHWLKLDNEWLIRKGEWAGITVPENWLSHYLPQDSESEEEEENGSDIMVHSQPDKMISDHPGIHVQHDDIFKLLSAGTLSCRLSLLTGEFKPRSSGAIYWNIWKKCAYSLLGLVILWGVKVSYETVQIRHQTTALHQESERIFRVVFPGRKKIPTTSYLKRQFNNELASLSGGSQGKTVLSIFEGIAQALKQKSNIELQSFSYDASRSEVKVDFKGNDFNAFEETRIALGNVFNVQQGPLNKSNDQVYGSYILTEK
ncbi:type II secretion system protein GspL [Vibrio salinus]|uniref:type II secretion system protein GspL n=1 Tax=Vibrio salinus TaxID=2899784 RepID=UPI001E369D8F|nr:type II secretion system protein GspL [Vibrio salinus]MCE0493861.1 type II secretion system protein GspL [Vibrio salinus]